MQASECETRNSRINWIFESLARSFSVNFAHPCLDLNTIYELRLETKRFVHDSSIALILPLASEPALSTTPSSTPN